MAGSIKFKVDWCSYAAAKYSCERWHYSRCHPSTMQKRVSVGAWEGGEFMGAIVFGHGANPQIGCPYGLLITECVELTRIALKRTHVTPVSRIMRFAIKFLSEANPGLRLIVSYADEGQGHHGGVYQASNWIYVGKTKGVSRLLYKGKEYHAKGFRTSFPGVSQSLAARLPASDKHKYILPLDAVMRSKVAPLSMPYPKRPKQDNDPLIHPTLQAAV